MVSAREHKPVNQPVSTGKSSSENKNSQVSMEADPEEKKRKGDPQFGFSGLVMNHGQTNPGSGMRGGAPTAKAAATEHTYLSADGVKTKGVLSPVDNFSGRSKVRYGVGEKINLDITSTDTDYIPPMYMVKKNDYYGTYDNVKYPSNRPTYEEAKANWEAEQAKKDEPLIHPSAEKLGGFQWSASAGTLARDEGNTGRTVYTAPDTATSVTLSLKRVKTGTIVYTKTIQIVAPDSGYVKRNTSLTPKLWHLANHVSAGFLGDFFLTPRDVSFSAVKHKEGVCTATVVGTGGFVAHDHDPADDWQPVLMPKNSSDGSEVETPEPGTEVADQAQMLYSAANSRNTGGKKIIPSTFTWNIPWIYKVGNGQAHTFTTVKQYGEGYDTGKMDVSKGGSGTFSQELNDPEFNVSPYKVYPAYP